MKIVKHALLLLSYCFVVIACTKDFEETNTDPNKLTKITAGSPLNPVIYEFSARNAVNYRNISAPLMQVFLKTDDFINAPAFYDFTENIGNSTWSTYYLQMNNLKEMEEAAIRDEMPNYEAIAITLKAYGYSMLTDCFGDVPMNDASKAEEGIWYPEFDEQEAIYMQLLDDLEYANGLYDEELPMPYVADVLYGNDVSKWQKFTNSLHLRLLLRISNRSETDAFTKITDIINDPGTYPIFTANEDGAVLQITGEPPLLSPWDRPQDFGVFRYYTEFFIDHFKELDDPRMPVYASTAKGLEGEDYGYIGEPIDLANAPLPDSIATASGVRRSLAEHPLIIPIMSYAELEFIKAEMAQRGYIQNGEEHYQNGVKAAIEMWGEEMPEGYFDNPDAAYNGSLERIMLQKYYALFFTDFQAWFEHRRTGFPQLPVSSSMKNNQEMPSRFYYPITEADRYNQHFQEAVDRMGGDEINIPAWWE